MLRKSSDQTELKGSRVKRYLAGTVVAGLLLVGSAAAGTSDDTPINSGSNEGNFSVECTFSHSAPDDPIVFPRGPGASHQHDFFGSSRTNAFSTNGENTNESIRRGTTSCVRQDSPWKDIDRAAYWVPTLYVNDQPVRARLSVRYNTGNRNAADVKPFPEDFKMIVGDAKGVNPNGRPYVRCDGATIAPPEGPGKAPTCDSRGLIIEPRFQDCWDGVNSDSPDHKSHVAFSQQISYAKAIRTNSPTNSRECPSTHPVLIPAIEATFRYPTSAGPTTRVASGDMNTPHADFMNGWQQDILEGLTKRCLTIGEYCGGSDKPVVGHGPGI